ncbi:HEPN/Toprim-associated domain-containing protein [Paraburkholderia bannensis]|uniref:HEPN/Toprim-associated domain-containing protein n=1 Tax=Paraburkholderia bannensis TaxID=765414 RepID=UPI002AB2567F|nr:HEPN/Toprim-associated domain-containing protein [Paraburkholderia bannensis]
MPIAYISIGGHIISEMWDGYSLWHFKCKDRLNRGGEDDAEYLYVMPAVELRQRLNDIGYDRSSLEREYREYENRIAQFTNLPYLEDAPKQAARRQYAVTYASLDDWLAALGEALKFYREHKSTRVGPSFDSYKSDDPFIDIELLAECVTNGDAPYRGGGVVPRHTRIGFPCESLEGIAYAMLEVVPDDAECVLDVTQFVFKDCTQSFDDPRLMPLRLARIECDEI